MYIEVLAEFKRLIAENMVCFDQLLWIPVFAFLGDDSAEEKKFEATERKKRRVREEGMVARSVELNNLAVLAVGFVLILLFWAKYVEGFRGYLMSVWSDFDFDAKRVLEKSVVFFAAASFPFLMAVFFSSLLVNFSQVGFFISFKPLAPDFTRLNPASGLKKIFNKKSVVNLLKTILKFVVFLLVLYKDVVSALTLLMHPVMDMQVLMGVIFGLVRKIVMKVLVIILVLAILDYAYERWSFSKEIMMTLTEMKEEMKNIEGNPEVKQEVKKRIKEILSMSAEERVKNSTMVITNPTHFAVAVWILEDLKAGIEYNGKMLSAVVTYKGVDEVALRIRKWAEEANLAVIRNPAIARYLYFNVPVGGLIPSRMLRVVINIYVQYMREKMKERFTGSA